MKAALNSLRKQGKISKYIYGQFAEHLGRCIYEGLYTEDENIPNKNGMRCDVVNALKELEIPVLRWPGGCFADDYHWRDGIGDKSKRPYMVNTNWGGVVENNHFGTHEFFELCEQLGTEPYICGNVGSGTVQEMRDWVEYMTFDGDSPLANERRQNGREKPWNLKFFGVGNENWGCGGNMRAEYYADEYRRYATFIRNYGEEPIYRIAGGPNVDDTHWMETLMQNVRHMTEGISLHNYTFETNWNNKGSAAQFDEHGWYSLMANAMNMEKVIKVHEAIMDRYDPESKIDLIVDEWGNWFDVETGTNPGFLYQQNTMRDAISGMLILHIFHNHNKRVKMANIAQMVNVLQAMVLTEGEKMVLTPTYHLFRMMKGHMDGEKLDVDYTAAEIDADGVKLPKISVSASEKNGAVTISMCNVSLDSDEDIEISLRDRDFTSAEAEILTSKNMNDCNTFDAPETVKPEKLDVTLDGGTLTVKLPKMSAAVITLK
ncbi:MAG: alpha-N-arabinofuranosidase [Hominilimicola sp.]